MALLILTANVQQHYMYVWNIYRTFWQFCNFNSLFGNENLFYYCLEMKKSYPFN